MKADKLYMVLKTLSKKDLKALDKFLELDGLGLTDADKKLIRHIISNWENDDEITKEWILDNLFGSSSAVSEKTWKHHLSRSQKAVNHFLVHRLTLNNPEISNPVLMDYYIEHGLTGKMTSGLIRQMDTYISKNRNYYYNFYKFKLSQWRAMYEKLDGANTSKHLQHCSDSLDAFYVESKLRLYIEVLTKRVDNKSAFEDSLMPQIPTYQEDTHQNDEVINIFHHIYDALLSGRYGNIDDLITKIIQNGYPHFERFLEKSILEQLINYCIYKINARKDSYAEKYIQIIRYLENKEVLLDSDYMSWQRYKNTITALLITGDIEEARDFIETYTSKLPEKFQKQAAILAKVKVEYTDDTINKETLEEFHKVEIKDVRGKISFGRLLIKLYYEDREKKRLTSLLKSLSKYVDRKRAETAEKAISDLLHSRIRGFISLVSKMMSGKQLSTTELENTTLYGVDYLWLKKHINKRDNK